MAAEDKGTLLALRDIIEYERAEFLPQPMSAAKKTAQRKAC